MKNTKKNVSRREFVRNISGGVAGLTLPLSISSCKNDKTIVTEQTNSTEQKKQLPGGPGYRRADDLVPRHVLGKTGLEVSRLSFGGGSQFMKNKDGDWEPLMQKALELGINYFDTHYDYVGSEERFAELLNPVRDQVIISTKFDARTVSGMQSEFEVSLKRLKTDYVDILMIHSIEEKDSVSQIENGVYKEMLKLKDQGTVRYIGFSSMNSAKRSKDLLENLDFDVVILALNPTTYGNFATVALPSAVKKNVGVLAMKVMRNVVGVAATAEELMHYALDKDGVCSAVIGHYGLNILEENAELAKKFAADTLIRDWSALEERCKPYAGPHALCWARDDYYDGKMV